MCERKMILEIQVSSVFFPCNADPKRPAVFSGVILHLIYAFGIEENSGNVMYVERNDKTIRFIIIPSVSKECTSSHFVLMSYSAKAPIWSFLCSGLVHNHISCLCLGGVR